MERRSTVRIDEPFPVTVVGVDARGYRFKINTVLSNISRAGLYLHLDLPQPFELGTKLFFIVRFSRTARHERPVPRFALRGVVVRTELKPSGAYGVAVAFTSYRHL